MTIESSRARAATVGILLVVVASFAGCGNDGDTTLPVVPLDTSKPSAEPATSAPSPVAIVGVYEAVEFYPACGNETLEHLGVTWSPIANVGFRPTDPTLQEKIDAVLAREREPSPVSGIRGLVRVVAPGPGDDRGTLVVWADGVARWVSESGELDVWMIDEEISYNWVC